MKRIYMALCPSCSVTLAADELNGLLGNDVGIPLLKHIRDRHPELVEEEHPFVNLLDHLYQRMNDTVRAGASPEDVLESMGFNNMDLHRFPTEPSKEEGLPHQ